MLTYVLRRLTWMVPTLIGITIVIFALIHAVPGDPAALQFGSESLATEGAAMEQRVAKFNSRYGFNRPLWKQYLSYVGPFNMRDDGHRWFGGSDEHPFGGLLALDLGREMQRPTVPVVEEIGRRLMVTVPLTLASVLLTYLIAVPVGIYSALRAGTRRDQGLMAFLFFLYSVPSFFGALMLILAFGPTGLDWLPTLGLHGKDAALMGRGEYVWDTLRHGVLPVAAMTYVSLAYLSRQMRVGMVEVIRLDYIRTARAKGLSERAVVLKHALRNSLIPVLTLFASILPTLIGGSIIVEQIFDIPGMGLYAYDGLLSRDYNIVMATTTFSALMTLLGVLMADVAYALVDPRIRVG